MKWKRMKNKNEKKNEKEWKIKNENFSIHIFHNYIT